MIVDSSRSHSFLLSSESVQIFPNCTDWPPSLLAPYITGKKYVPTAVMGDEKLVLTSENDADIANADGMRAKIAIM